MLLVVGLGNPGKKYENNRHNIGFMAVDRFVCQHSFSAYRSKFKGEVAFGKIGSDKALALKPTTFMNESGRSVQAAVDFYDIPTENIIVIHDDIDLVEGKVRVKTGGGHAGHNGLRSLHAHVGTDFMRVRIGVGHPGDKVEVPGYVLNDFSKLERGLVDKIVDAVGEYIPILFEENHSLFMTKIAAISGPPRSRPEFSHGDAKHSEKKGD